MNTWFKRVLLGLVLVLVLALAGLAVFLLTFDPNAYKSRLQDLVMQRYNRVLSIQGDIGLSLFPRIGLSVEGVYLSERDEEQTFLSIEGARLAVALWPLLSKRLIVDHVAITGLDARVRRDAEGRFNFADLLQDGVQVSAEGETASLPEPAGNKTADKAAVGEHSDLWIDIAGLELKNGKIEYEDEASGLVSRLTNLSASTGRITFDQSFDVSLKADVSGQQPEQEGRLEAQALVKMDPAAKEFAAQKIAVRFAGRLAELAESRISLKGSLAYDDRSNGFSANELDFSLTGDLQGDSPIKGLKTSLTVDRLELDPGASALDIKQLSLRASGQYATRDLEWAVDAPAVQISPQAAKGGPISSSLKWTGTDTLAATLKLDGLAGDANEWRFRTAALESMLTQGDRLLQLKMTTPLVWNMAERKGVLGAIKGDIGVQEKTLPDGSFEAPLIGIVQLDLAGDRLDADLTSVLDGAQTAFKASVEQLAQPRIKLSLMAEKLDLNRWLPSSSQASSTPSDSKDDKAEQKTADAAGEAAGQLPDLAFLNNRQLTADIKIDELIVQDLQLQQVLSQVLIQKNSLQVPKLSANLYEGTLNGQFSLASDYRLGGKLDLAGVSVSPLMHALSGEGRLSGKGSMKLDLRAHGQTSDALMRSLNGTVGVQLHDGAIHGVDAESALKDISAALEQVLQGRIVAMPSPFGPGHSTPFSKLVGNLAIKNGQGTISQLMLESKLIQMRQGKPATVDFPAKQLDLMLHVKVADRPPKQIAVLAGTTVPVRISGPWSELSYAVQWDQMRNQVVRGAVKAGLQEIISGALKDTNSEDASKPDKNADSGGSSSSAAKDDSLKGLGKALKGILGR